MRLKVLLKTGFKLHRTCPCIQETTIWYNENYCVSTLVPELAFCMVICFGESEWQWLSVWVSSLNCLVGLGLASWLAWQCNCDCLSPTVKWVKGLRWWSITVTLGLHWHCKCIAQSWWTSGRFECATDQFFVI